MRGKTKRYKRKKRAEKPTRNVHLNVVSIDKLAVDEVSGLQDNRSGRLRVMLALVGSKLATIA